MAASCSNDSGRAKALQSFREDLNTRRLETKALIDQLSLETALLKENHIDPIEKKLDEILSNSETVRALGLQKSSGSGYQPSATPTRNLLETLDLRISSTKEDIEEDLSSRYGIHIANGYLLMEGDFSLVAVKPLYEYLGYSQTLLQSYLNEDEGSFVFIITNTVIEYSAETSCGESVITGETTTVLGINQRISTVLAANADLSLSDLDFHIFWIGAIDHSDRRVNQLRRFGLSDSEMALVMIGENGDNLNVYTVENPIDLANMNYPEETIDRILRREDLDSIALEDGDIETNTEDIANALIESLSGRNSMDRNSQGMTVLENPALLVAQTINWDSLSSVQDLADIPDNLDPTEYDDNGVDQVATATSAISASFELTTDSYADFQTAINDGMGQVFEVLTTVENLISTYVGGGTPLAQCLFGGGTLNISVTGPLVDELSQAVVSASASVLTVFNLLSSVASAMSIGTCIARTMLASMLGNTVDLLSTMPCVNIPLQNNFEFPETIPDDWSNQDPPEPRRTFERLMAVVRAMDVVVRGIISMSRQVATWMRSIGANTSTSFNSPESSCNPTSAINLIAQLNIEATL